MAPWFLRCNNTNMYFDIANGFVSTNTLDCVIYVCDAGDDFVTVHNIKHAYLSDAFKQTQDPRAAGKFKLDSNGMIHIGSHVLMKENIIFNNIDLTTHGLNLERDGFTVLEKYVDDATINEIKSKLNLPETSPHQVRHGNLLELDPIFGSMLKDSTVLSIVQMFLEGSAKCATWSSNTLYKEEIDSYRPHWHVDFPYHDIPSQGWTPNIAMSAQVLWLLDDFTKDNGGTYIVKGSHKFQSIPNAENMTGLNVDIVQYTKGSVVISHGAWWHSQGCNTTNNSRTALLGTFVQKWMLSKDDMVSQYNKMGHQDDVLRAIL